jgi:hypothetical protein
MDDIQFGKVAGSLILTVLLGWIFTLFAKDGDPATLDNRIKKSVSMFAGIGLGILGMYYTATGAGSNPTLVTWVDYIFTGILMGSSAIGFNQLMKGGK